MIQYDLIEKQGILIVTPKAALEKEDFEILAKIVDPFIESYGELKGLMIYMKTFPNWKDFAALISHLRFVKDHHKFIARAAAVTDSSFLSIMPSIVAHFVHSEISHFDYNEKGSAMCWLTGKD